MNDPAENKPIGTCPVCGKKFVVWKITQIYCSPECRYFLRRKRQKLKYKKRPEQNRVCPICKRKFSTTRLNQIYCCQLHRYYGKKIRLEVRRMYARDFKKT